MHKIDCSRMWKLPETGGMIDRDEYGNSPKRLYLRRGGAEDMSLPEFVRANHKTLLPAVNAAGETVTCVLCFVENACRSVRPS